MPSGKRRSPGAFAALAVPVLLAALSGCATTPAHPPVATSGVVTVVAAEGVWGDLAAQLGGAHAKVTSIIDNPATDPHDYEPTAPDAIAVSRADLAIVNGIGYDTWARRMIDADPDPHRTVIDVGETVGVPNGGNPHRWYSPTDVRTVIDTITSDYAAIDPAHATYFREQHDRVLGVALKPYFDAIAQIKAAYAGTPVGASESIFAPLAGALGLDLLTPASFLAAVSEGTDPSAADKAAIDAQIDTGKIRVYVYNSQNATPDVSRQVDEAGAHHIPVTIVTETPTPAGVSFEDWQVAQLTALRAALAQAAGA
ncbi:MAG TPA: zinc ABC transporter substrate-binding protein [Micromonosporaceae bacterium]|nr:zinc ABC transporter substrate-binding protein [Micromonosporaceae bacterium]